MLLIFLILKTILKIGKREKNSLEFFYLFFTDTCIVKRLD